jgi:hypothetical protein
MDEVIERRCDGIQVGGEEEFQMRGVVGEGDEEVAREVE